MPVHENEEDQAVSLAIEAKFVLSLIHNRYTKNNKKQEHTTFYNSHYQIQYIKFVQHQNVNMTWDYQKFHRHPVAAEISKREEKILFFQIIIDFVKLLIL